MGTVMGFGKRMAERLEYKENIMPLKKALILYTHGLGDVIVLTPCLKKLYEDGYIVDLMCRKEVRTTHLLDECPYVDDIIDTPNPWSGNKDEIENKNIELFNALAKNYDWSGMALHNDWDFIETKSEMNARELGLEIIYHNPEVFIKDEYKGCEGNYLFLHWEVPAHPGHTWKWDDSIKWCEDNLMYDDVWDTTAEDHHEDINEAFAVLRDASCRVICSSVFVHAADAMGIPVDVISYGTMDRKVLPETKPRNIRELGIFCERSNRIWKKWED